ncbi:hypothetical protein ERJ75_000958700 [Trypanosoma vivax]|uniref:Uncharacterized protein n=1 Tax=Trypanosoma vivax (strain Y486) TaxID=1055687 RepID=G0U4T6_TRYVY|nr:hypothetical protein TRVL_05821 [Trypanosoma vivax]KAH8611971.1 hypothetical protein ERJ75_000958700 [Trypanosoma vivax]CCC52451.1 conserved hypothetical protein [Trypanosoma vivax Y486]
MGGKYRRLRDAARERRARVNTTGDQFRKAIRNFQEMLRERMAQHEEEAFTARALFKMRHAREQRRFHEKHVQSVANELHTSDTQDEQQFLADQQKLQEEHEEELRKVLPLAFLDEETSAVLSLTFASMLENNLNRVARRSAGIRKTGVCCKEIGAASDPSVSLSRVSKLVSEEAKQYKLLNTDVPLGLMSTSPTPEENDDTLLASFNEQLRGSSARSNITEQDMVSSLSSSPSVLLFFSGVTTRGAADFARIAFLSNMQSRRERREEYVSVLADQRNFTPETNSSELIKKEMDRISAEEKRDEEETKTFLAVYDLLISRISDMETVHPGGVGAAALAGEASNPCDPGSIGVGMGKAGHGATWCHPAEFMRKVRHQSFVSRCKMFARYHKSDGADTEDHCDSLGDHVSELDELKIQKEVFDWVTITLDGDGMKNGGSELERMAESYMWPRHVEENIPHVMYGEVIPSFRCVQYQHNSAGSSRVAAINSDDVSFTKDGCPAEVYPEGNADEPPSSAKDVSIFRMPSSASKVWLKVNSMGEFTADRVRFLQCRFPL